MLATCDVLCTEMESHGIPKIFIPTAEISRFGQNMFLIGYIDDHFDINCIETIYPNSNVPLKLTPWLRSNLNQVPDNSTETDTVTLQCNLCAESYNIKHFWEHFKTHQESLQQVTEHTDVLFSLKLAKEMILSHLMAVYN